MAVGLSSTGCVLFQEHGLDEIFSSMHLQGKAMDELVVEDQPKYLLVVHDSTHDMQFTWARILPPPRQ